MFFEYKMKYGFRHDRGKEIPFTELERMAEYTKEKLTYLIDTVEHHPLENGIRFAPSKDFYKKDINLILREIGSEKNWILGIYKD